MDGPDCPIHKIPMWWVSTTNQWCYYCKLCDKRYNDSLDEMSHMQAVEDKAYAAKA